MNIIKSLKTTLLAVALAMPGILTTSCDDNIIFEDQGDCTVRYYLQFVYEMNMKNADAFPAEVESVNLYAFDENGLFVKEFQESGDVLDKPGYLMELDLQPGQYTFVGWCGLVNEDGVRSFTVPDMVPGQTTIDELTCTLNAEKTRAAGDVEYSDSKLHFMYHGMIEAFLPDLGEGYQLNYYYTMPLIKDTNHIRVMLQELNSTKDMEVRDYDFSIEIVDGLLLYNNAVSPESPSIIYDPWEKQSNYIGVGNINPDDSTIKYHKGIIADFMTSRLMADQQNTSFLTITDTNTGKVIAKVPYIQYPLMSLEYFRSTYPWARNMTEQELLDRMDEYEMTFFLEQGQWVSVQIDILSWRVVIHNYELD